MNKPAEGVAAPLEPLTPEQYLKEWDSFANVGVGRPFSYWMQFAQAYAAAVSKNLQQELSLMEKKFDSLMADSNAIIKQRESRIVELESEITALRETKP